MVHLMIVKKRDNRPTVESFVLSPILVQSLGWEDPLEDEMAPHSTILA